MSKETSSKHHRHPSVHFSENVLETESDVSVKGPVSSNAPSSSANCSLVPSSSVRGHHHHRRTSMGHRRAKSAGNAASHDFSHYAATGLYSRQSGEPLDRVHHQQFHPQQPPILFTMTPVLKKTLSESTVRFVDGQAMSNSQIFMARGYPADQSSHRHGSIKYSSLKSHSIDPPNLSYFDSEIEHEDTECRLFSFSLGSLQRFARIQIFVLLCCILVTLQQALSSGYFNSVITTIQKRFDISSQMSGAIVSTFEMGNLLTIIFVSYFGTHRHIPRWIGTGVVITAIGSLIFALPHFMSLSNPFGGIGAKGNLSEPYSGNTCRIPKPAFSTSFLGTASQFINLNKNEDDPTCVEETNYSTPQMLVFMFAMVLIGCGGTPIFTLGTTFIDDHVPKESASIYMGCMYSMVAFGLVCGFLLGGFFINVHENALGTGVIPADIFPGHPKWIGAWWVGFFLLGILLLVISLPFFIFPKSLKRKRSKDGTVMVCSHSSARNPSPTALSSSNTAVSLHHVYPSQSSAVTQLDKSSNSKQVLVVEEDAKSQLDSTSTGNKKYGRKLSEIPACMWRLACNPIYMVTTLGSCMELAIVSGFLIFLPKYLETQFSMGKSEANLFAGGIAIPGACVGIFLGGYLLKRLQLSPKGAIQLVLFFSLVCMGLYTALYFLGCENVRMAGTTLPYANSSQFDNFRVNLTSECNLGCRCSPNDLEPVCDLRNKISYYSPCFAGCTSVNSDSREIRNYSNCACLPQTSTTGMTRPGNDHVTMVPLVTPGPCPQQCSAMFPFMFLLFLITLVVSITQMPVVMITLRSVAEEERSLALGMQFVLFRLFGYIPSPIVFGNVIDSTCLVWKAHCGEQGGFCLLYNIEQFRLRYVGVCSFLKVAAALLFFLDWLLICYREKRKLKSSPLQIFSAEEVASSIISLDRLSVFGTWDAPETIPEAEDEELQPLGATGANGQDSDYNSAMEETEEDSASSSSSAVNRQPGHGSDVLHRRRHSQSHIV